MSPSSSPHAKSQLEKAWRLAGLLRSWGFQAEDVARFSDADWQQLCLADKLSHRAARSWRAEVASEATRLMVLGCLVKT